MEDAYISDGAMPGLPGWTFFAVLDGHAGKVCAEVAAEQLSAYAPKCRRHIYIYTYILRCIPHSAFVYSMINVWIGFGEAPRSSLISTQR